MRLKIINKLSIFLLVVTLLPSILACSDSQFLNGVDLDSGKIHYSIADGAYYSESPCFNSNLTGSIVVTNFSIPYDNRIGYYPNSSRIGLIDFFDNTSLFYTYSANNLTLSKVYLMNPGGNYLFKTNFSYSLDRLSRVESYIADDELISSMDFVIEPDKMVVSSESTNETFLISDGKIQNRTQIVAYENETYTLIDSFDYYNDKTVVIEKYNNSIVSGLVYDKNEENVSLNCYDFDEGDSAVFMGALASYGGNFFYDSCKDNSTLIENYCGINIFRWDFWNMNERIEKQKEVTCELGCFDGKCVENPEFECINDTDCSAGEICLDSVCIIDTDLPEEPEMPTGNI